MSYNAAFAIETSDNELCWFQVIESDVVFEKRTDNYGVPTGQTKCTKISLVLRSNTNPEYDNMLAEWIVVSDMRKKCYLAVRPAEGGTRRGGSAGTLELMFHDTYCTKFRTKFTSESSSESRRALDTLRANTSEDAYTIELELSAMGVMVNNSSSVTSPHYRINNEGGGGNASSGQSSSSGVSSYRAD